MVIVNLPLFKVGECQSQPEDTETQAILVLNPVLSPSYNLNPNMPRKEVMGTVEVMEGDTEVAIAMGATNQGMDHLHTTQDVHSQVQVWDMVLEVPLSKGLDVDTTITTTITDDPEAWTHTVPDIMDTVDLIMTIIEGKTLFCSVTLSFP